MGTDYPMLESAVILPYDDEDVPSPTLSTKRKQSTSSYDADSAAKKRRLSSSAAPTTDPPSSATNATSESSAPPARRARAPLDEKKRNQRLFGALIGTLAQGSRPDRGAAQARRQDAERKQREKLTRQAEEDAARRKEKVEKLMGRRRKAQRRFDADTMRICHKNKLAEAHFLVTKTEPKLFYLPWTLLPEQATRIKDQVQEAEAEIEKERSEWEVKEKERDEQEEEDLRREREKKAGEDTDMKGNGETNGDSNNGGENKKSQVGGSRNGDADGDVNMEPQGETKDQNGLSKGEDSVNPSRTDISEQVDGGSRTDLKMGEAGNDGAANGTVEEPGKHDLTAHPEKEEAGEHDDGEHDSGDGEEEVIY